MSLKGTVIDRHDHPLIPRGLRQRGTVEQLEAFIAAHNARWAIVGHCRHCTLPDGSPRPLVAEEVVAHRLQHLAGGARGLAGRFEQAAPKDRAAFLAYLAEHYPDLLPRRQRR